MVLVVIGSEGADGKTRTRYRKDHGSSLRHEVVGKAKIKVQRVRARNAQTPNLDAVGFLPRSIAVGRNGVGMGNGELIGSSVSLATFVVFVNLVSIHAGKSDRLDCLQLADQLRKLGSCRDIVGRHRRAREAQEGNDRRKQRGG